MNTKWFEFPLLPAQCDELLHLTYSSWCCCWFSDLKQLVQPLIFGAEVLDQLVPLLHLLLQCLLVVLPGLLADLQSFPQLCDGLLQLC